MRRGEPRRVRTTKFRRAETSGVRLTRRDAVAALAAAGVVGVTAGAGAIADRSAPRADADPDLPVSTLSAAAEVLYPAALEGHRAFVGTYVAGRMVDRPAYRAGVATAAGELDDVARDWYGAPYADLPAGTRESLLDELAADTADPVPDGTLAERLRYYVVEELLYALYTSPTGGRLVGTENPVGYPGGTRSYRRADVPDASGGDGPGGTGEGAEAPAVRGDGPPDGSAPDDG